MPGHSSKTGGKTNRGGPPPKPRVLGKGTESLVERLARALRKRRPRFAAALGKGAKPAELARLEKELGEPLPASLRELFAWQGGRTLDSFFENQYLLGLAEARGVREGTLQFIKKYKMPPGYWSEKWVPLLSNGAGDYLCVDLGGAFGGRPGQLVDYFHDSDDRLLLWPSLDAFLEYIVVALEHGELKIDADGLVDIGGKEALKVRRRVLAGWSPPDHSAKEPLVPVQRSKRPGTRQRPSARRAPSRGR
ncbi:MAG: SMI1/KNR4 family protein [Myxococcaceae bacterium]|nr:SMI1/KNR4 family protein [Myxococcaceae bacterium]